MGNIIDFVPKNHRVLITSFEDIYVKHPDDRIKTKPRNVFVKYCVRAFELLCYIILLFVLAPISLVFKIFGFQDIAHVGYLANKLSDLDKWNDKDIRWKIRRIY